MIEAILFDKDGTLFDFRESWGRWALSFLGSIAADEAHLAALSSAVGFDLAARQFRPDSVVIAGTAFEIAELLTPLMPGHSQESLTLLIDQATTKAEMVPAVPLIPLFEALRARGLKLGVATNDSEAPARAHLAAHGLSELVDFIAGYDSGYGAKPEPGMCLAFAQTLGLDPARVVMVGDSRHDLSAGRAAGMRALAVLTGIAGEDDLAPHADHLLRDIGQIPDWLDTLARA